VTRAPSADGALVTVQNLGGNKLDLYARRTVEHSCEIREDTTVCDTTTEIANRTPRGLTRFQYQYRPYGLFKNYVEIYIPEAARLDGVTAGGRAVRFSNLAEDGYRAIGAYLKIQRGQEGSMRVSYTLPAGERGYTLSVLPQPLARDARVAVNLVAPAGWSLSGPESSRVTDGVLRFGGTLRGPLEFEAGPDARTGLAKLWSGFSRFLREPLF